MEHDQSRTEVLDEVALDDEETTVSLLVLYSPDEAPLYWVAVNHGQVDEATAVFRTTSQEATRNLFRLVTSGQFEIEVTI